MHRYLGFLLVALFVVGLGSLTFAADQQRDRQQDRTCVCDNYVDVDGDGVCDNCDGVCNPDAPDDDGDGIPNGQDDDYSPPQDGSGKGKS